MSFDDTIEAIKQWLDGRYDTVFAGSYFTPPDVALVALCRNSIHTRKSILVLKKSVLTNRSYGKAIQVALSYRLKGFCVYVISPKLRYYRLAVRLASLGVGLLHVTPAGVVVIREAVISKNTKLASFLRANKHESLFSILNKLNKSCQQA